MATMLMVESWLNSTGRSLPPLLAARGHRYVLLTRDPGLYRDAGGRPHPAVAGAERVVTVETNDLAATLACAAELHAATPFDGVITTCDYYLATVAAVADQLGLPGARPDVMLAATRKHLVRRALGAAGLPNPGFAEVHTAAAGAAVTVTAVAERLGYPLVAKPVDLNAGTSVRLVADEAALKDAFWDVHGMVRNTRGQRLERILLLEEVLTGVEVSVEAVTVDGETTVVGITDKSIAGPPAFVESGHMFPAGLTDAVAADVSAFVIDALAAVGFTHGVSHTEVMVTADGPRLVEINPRQGGGYIFDLVELVSGTNVLGAAVDLALGHTPSVGTAAEPQAGAIAAGGSAAVFFAIAPRAGRIVAVDGLDGLDADPGVVRWSLPTPVEAPNPVDNEAYLGHVLAVDRHGGRARALVEEAVASLRFRYADGGVTGPLGMA